MRFDVLFRSHLPMAKGVAVLSSSAGVSGTIYFTQEGDGNLIKFFAY